MSKKTSWRHLADNSIAGYESEEEHKTRMHRIFKTGMAIDRMPTTKPKFNKVKKLDTPTEEE